MRRIYLKEKIQTIEVLILTRYIRQDISVLYEPSYTYKRMDFKNVNFLNNRVNTFSGNLLPTTTDNSRFPIIYYSYSIATWLTQLIYTIALIFGIILSPMEKGLKDGTLSVVVILEMFFMLTHLHLHKKLLREMIQNINDILENADDLMKDIVKSAIKPIIMPFVIYGVTSVISVAIYHIQPIVLVFEKSRFFYVDYNMPAAFSTEPFSSRVLIPSTIIMTIGGVYLFLKKFGVDVYMMHLVLMLTAQYRYTVIKLSIIFRDLRNSHDESQEKHRSMKDRWTEKELKKICHHQNTVLK